MYLCILEYIHNYVINKTFLFINHDKIFIYLICATLNDTLPDPSHVWTMDGTGSVHGTGPEAAYVAVTCAIDTVSHVGI